MREEGEKVPSVTFQEYCKKVQEISFRFQYLEETLKVYLAMCFEIVGLSLGGRLFFGFSYDDVERLSLGKLIARFSKYNGNKDLCKLLYDLTKERNHIAHKAYLLTEEKIKDSEVLAKEFEKVVKIRERVLEANKALYEEGRIVEALLLELNRPRFAGRKK